MRHIAAYLLLQLGGNASPTAKDIVKLLSVAGIEADESRLAILIDQLKDKDINELIAEGSLMLSSVPSGGAQVSESHVVEEDVPPDGDVSDSDSDIGMSLFD
ncbi:60S acidic ribosomal protein P2 [Mycena floridula]|nr:60S acidic ribosomal protein P2 [Mycena floridula]